MKVGLKAGHSLIEDTSMFYDSAVSVECLEWDACDVSRFCDQPSDS